MYQDLSKRHDWPVKKATVYLPIKIKANSKRISGISLSPLEALNKDSGAASQTLLIEIKLRLRRRQHLIAKSAGLFQGPSKTVKNSAIKDDFCPETYDRSRLFFLHKMHSIVI